MSLAEIIGQVAGGGLLGGIFAFLNAREERARMREANAHEIALLQVKTDAATAAGEAKAFAASHQSAAGEGMLAKLPDRTSTAQIWLALSVEALRTCTRPLLTWGLVAAAYMKPELSGMASLAVSWWFGSRPAFRFTR